MQFALGLIAGLATSGVIFSAIAALRGERRMDNAATAIRRAAREIDAKVPVNLPIGKGFVEIPPDDDELARQEIIAENKAKGLPTPVSTLRP